MIFVYVQNAKPSIKKIYTKILQENCIRVSPSSTTEVTFCIMGWLVATLLQLCNILYALCSGESLLSVAFFCPPKIKSETNIPRVAEDLISPQVNLGQNLHSLHSSILSHPLTSCPLSPRWSLRAKGSALR